MEAGLHAIVMAGGRGARLSQNTRRQPKAVGQAGHELHHVRVVLYQLRHHGFSRITVCVSYLAETVISAPGLRPSRIAVEYRADDAHGGTAGPLRDVSISDDHALVVNADVLTTMDFRRMYQTHAWRDAALTVSAVQA